MKRADQKSLGIYIDQTVYDEFKKVQDSWPHRVSLSALFESAVKEFTQKYTHQTGRRIERDAHTITALEAQTYTINDQ